MSRYIQCTVLSIVLITFALWGYLGSSSASITALIPVVIGLAILFCVPFVKKGSKIARRICVVLTVLVVVGLIKPLIGALGREDLSALARVLFMMTFGIYTLLSSFYCPRCK